VQKLCSHTNKNNPIEAGATAKRTCRNATLPYQSKSKYRLKASNRKKRQHHHRISEGSDVASAHHTHFEQRDLIVERFHHHSLFPKSMFRQQEEYRKLLKNNFSAGLTTA
jgi:hypothetical protein